MIIKKKKFNERIVLDSYSIYHRAFGVINLKMASLRDEKKLLACRQVSIK